MICFLTNLNNYIFLFKSVPRKNGIILPQSVGGTFNNDTPNTVPFTETCNTGDSVQLFNEGPGAGTTLTNRLIGFGGPFSVTASLTIIRVG